MADRSRIPQISYHRYITVWKPTLMSRFTGSHFLLPSFLFLVFSFEPSPPSPSLFNSLSLFFLIFSSHPFFLLLASSLPTPPFSSHPLLSTISSTFYTLDTFHALNVSTLVVSISLSVCIVSLCRCIYNLEKSMQYL